MVVNLNPATPQTRPLSNSGLLHFPQQVYLYSFDIILKNNSSIKLPEEIMATGPLSGEIFEYKVSQSVFFTHKCVNSEMYTFIAKVGSLQK